VVTGDAHHRKEGHEVNEWSWGLFVTIALILIGEEIRFGAIKRRLTRLEAELKLSPTDDADSP
jgi:hypothetical protein